MRINKFVALASGISRRKADAAILDGRVLINGLVRSVGYEVKLSDEVTLDRRVIKIPDSTTTIMLNKPVGYVVSRDGQGNRTIYELLPEEYQQLKPIGRLDKNSSGLLLLTNDGLLANELTHPSKRKTKIYEVSLNKPLQPLHHQMIVDHGIQLEDGLSRLQLSRQAEADGKNWIVSMQEGRNRQIRRTFFALSYKVTELHRTNFGSYQLGALKIGVYKKLI